MNAPGTAPGQAAYEAIANDLKLPAWEDLPEWQRQMLGAVVQVADETRAIAAAAPAPELTAYEADIASLTDQRNRVSDTADRLRMQVRHLRDALERCRDAADRSPAAVHAIASQALASSQEDGE